MLSIARRRKNEYGLTAEPQKSSIAYEDTIAQNVTTLTRTNLQANDGVIQGLLYVPDIPPSNPCHEQQFDIIPRNATTQADLPPTNYNLIALAPWFNSTCTKAYLAAARLDPIRGFIFYRPNNSSREPQDVDSPIWDLDDDDAWRGQNQFPVFAVPGSEGSKMMDQLSYYSGEPSTIPFADEVADRYDPNDGDYIRIWTELSIHDSQDLPAMWTWILIVIGVLLFIIICVSLTMHLIQRQRRASLRRRVISGEVDLEAMGIKRLTVPHDHIKTFPLFTYSFQPNMISTPSTPLATRSLRSPRSIRTEHRTMSDVVSTTRTRRSSVASSINTVASNYQPQCHICLESYEDRVSIIRELPCGHIYHPECVDEFLGSNSSLCPICKKNMLPRGYCPRITNGMVRRERALRRLRERVVLEDSDEEEGSERKRRNWKDWILRRGETSPVGSDVPMTPVTPVKDSPSSTEATDATQEAQAQNQRTLDPPQEEPQEEGGAGEGEEGGQQPQAPQPATTAHHSRRQKRRRKPRNLQLRAPRPGEPPLAPQQAEGRKSPSALARQRMRTLAGTPFDDPDGRRPICKPLSFSHGQS